MDGLFAVEYCFCLSELFCSIAGLELNKEREREKYAECFRWPLVNNVYVCVRFFLSLDVLANHHTFYSSIP